MHRRKAIEVHIPSGAYPEVGKEQPKHPNKNVTWKLPKPAAGSDGGRGLGQVSRCDKGHHAEQLNHPAKHSPTQSQTVSAGDDTSGDFAPEASQCDKGAHAKQPKHPTNQSLSKLQTAVAGAHAEQFKHPSNHSFAQIPTPAKHSSSKTLLLPPQCIDEAPVVHHGVLPPAVQNIRTEPDVSLVLPQRQTLTEEILGRRLCKAILEAEYVQLESENVPPLESPSWSQPPWKY